MVLTSYFNPLRWRRRRANDDRFRAALVDQSVPVLTVEQALGDGDFDLDDGAGVMRIRGGDLMFQKERLLALGLRCVPGRYAFVAGLDCDVIFEDPGWAKDTVALLSDSPARAVQPFHHAIWRGPEADSPDVIGNRPDIVARALAAAPAGHANLFLNWAVGAMEAGQLHGAVRNVAEAMRLNPRGGG